MNRGRTVVITETGPQTYFAAGVSLLIGATVVSLVVAGLTEAGWHPTMFVTVPVILALGCGLVLHGARLPFVRIELEASQLRSRGVVKTVTVSRDQIGDVALGRRWVEPALVLDVGGHVLSIPLYGPNRRAENAESIRRSVEMWRDDNGWLIDRRAGPPTEAGRPHA